MVVQMDQKLNHITDLLHHLVSSSQGGNQSSNKSSQRNDNSDLFLSSNTLPTYEQLTVPRSVQDDAS
ncbi:UNVERIFIED_CONTAM: hypothetical protein K2H54_060387 [Gekko kuhli]